MNFAKSGAPTRSLTKNRRRAMIMRRSIVAAGRAKRMDPMARSAGSLAAQRRHARERMLSGRDPLDHTLEHSGNPDHEIDQLPDSLTEDR